MGSDDDLGVRLPDSYERQYMSGSGRVLYRDKSLTHWAWHALILVVAAGSAFSLAVTAPWIIPFPLAAWFILWTLFAVLRVTITADCVHVQYGMFGPTIPIDSIQAAESIEYDWKKYGGWGIRLGTDGSWAYNMMGDQGRAVRVRWRDDRGKDKTTLFSSREPDLVADTIRRAMAKARVRVAPEPDPDEVEASGENEQPAAERGRPG